MASKRVLIISVGGSCAPVVNACREYDPDYIYFFVPVDQKVALLQLTVQEIRVESLVKYNANVARWYL